MNGVKDFRKSNKICEKIFSLKCYHLLKKIPRGRITTYKSLAEALGTKAFRAVGNAMNRNPYKDVPCQRVVHSDGTVGGFALGKGEKIKLLKSEGIQINGEKINLERYFFKVK